MPDGRQVRFGQQVHGTVGHIDIVERHPATNQVGWHTFPVGVVLVPKDGAAVVGGFVEGLVVEELDIGADEVFGNVEDAGVVEQLPEVDAALAHLHDLQHLLVGTVLFVEVVGVVDGQVAEAPVLARLGKEAIVFIAQQGDEVVVEQLADDDEAAAAE